MTNYRLGIDIGGTFTDLVLMDDDTGQVTTLKTPSVPHDPAEGITNGIELLARSNSIDPRDIHYFAHGQTFALNTVLQRAGARTGLLVTEGFRDILSIGRLRLSDPIDFFGSRPVPLVAPSDVREIGERVTANGIVAAELDLLEVERAVAGLLSDGVEALAICFMHSYAFPEHERRAAEHLRERFPELYVSTSSEVWPEQREFERCMVTVLNAYVGARMHTYFGRLAERTEAIGMPAALRITKSNGGIMTASSATRAPVETLLSGPASGVTGAIAVARRTGLERFVTVDMGGTSVDIAIVDGEIPYSSASMLEEFPVIIPTVEISSIGAGGGSIAWVDPSGVLKVGPRSAGSMPGPACYGLGSVEPTVTDAYVAAGIVDPDNFLGGRQKLDRDASMRALGVLGDKLGMTALAAASAVLDVATVKMYAQLMPLLARRGVDPTEFAIVAFGGAGPTHALLLAQETGITTVVIPWSPGTLCGFGALITDLRQDFVRTVGMTAPGEDDDRLRAEYLGMEREAVAWLDEQGESVDEIQLRRSADVQFAGQSFTIGASLAADEVPTASALRREFVAAYERAYGIRDETTGIEITNLRLSIIGTIPKPGFTSEEPSDAAEAVGRTRTIVEKGVEVEALVYQRDDLAVGQGIVGPAVVEAPDTTVYLPTGVSAVVDSARNIVATVRSTHA